MGSKLEQQAEALYRKEMAQALVAWRAVSDLMEDEMADGTRIKEIRIQGPQHTGGGFRGIVKGQLGTRNVVAFHNADNLKNLLVGINEAVRTDNIRWREDIPFGERPDAQATRVTKGKS